MDKQVYVVVCFQDNEYVNVDKVFENKTEAEQYANGLNKDYDNFCTSKAFGVIEVPFVK